MVWLLTSCILIGFYCLLLLLYRYWLQQLKPLHVPTAFVPSTRFSLIIPARNEAAGIASCLEQVLQLNYPSHLLEVIVVDDFSEDNTADIVRSFHAVRLVQLQELVQQPINAYKKKAIETGIAMASGDYIVTTDADCLVPADWLLHFAWMIEQQQSMFIAAPVVMKKASSFISLFQHLDFMSLQGITAASVGAGFHSMCNGANLCYSKQAFTAVNGFSGIDHIASGDDMLLMHKIKTRFPKQVHYCYAAGCTVQTEPVQTVNAFLRQRIRWASKARQYRDQRITSVLVLVYATNLWLLILAAAGIFHHQLWLMLLVAVASKTIAELIFLLPVAAFFRSSRHLLWFPLMQPFHIVYTVVAGWLGQWGQYQWKGRTVR